MSIPDKVVPFSPAPVKPLRGGLFKLISVPGLSTQAIQGLEATYPGTLTADMRSLLSTTCGLTSCRPRGTAVSVRTTACLCGLSRSVSEPLGAACESDRHDGRDVGAGGGAWIGRLRQRGMADKPRGPPAGDRF